MTTNANAPNLMFFFLSKVVKQIFTPPIKCNMSQPSSMFVAGDICQTILGAFFLGHPVLPVLSTILMSGALSHLMFFSFEKLFMFIERGQPPHTGF